MKKHLIWACILVAVLPGRATAQSKDLVGWSLVAGGTVLVISAFNWSDDCPTGATTVDYRSNDYSVYGRTCISSSRYTNSVNVGPPVMDVKYARPSLLYAGLGALAMGTVVLLVPDSVRPYAPSVAVGADSWRLGKTFRWGR